MHLGTTTLTAVIALMLGAQAGVAQEERTITVPLGDSVEQQPAGDGQTFVATPEPGVATTAQAVAPSPAPGEPPVTTQDSSATPGPAGDAQPEATGTADPTAEQLTQTPQPGTAEAETDQAAAPVVTEDAATTEAPEASEPAAPEATEAEPALAEPETPEAGGGAQEPANVGGETGEPASDVDAAAATEPAAEAPAEEAEPAAEPEETAAEPATEEAAEEAATEEEAPAEEEAAAAEPAEAPHQEISDVAFSFEGPFGRYDQFQLQRGLQVYTEVCSSCHGMRYVPIRTLGDTGGPDLPDDQVRAYAATMDIDDPETGESRPRLPTDHFPTVTGEGMGPDLSVMAKARAGFHGPYGTGISQLFNGIGGPEYVYSILTHYTGETKDEAGTTYYENTAFPGGWIAMPPPLSDDLVTYEDGHPAMLQDLATDVSAFMMWTAEPKMMARKWSGLVSVIFLIGLTVLLYLSNKRLWWPVKHGSRGH